MKMAERMDEELVVEWVIALLKSRREMSAADRNLLASTTAEMMRRGKLKAIVDTTQLLMERGLV